MKICLPAVILEIHKNDSKKLANLVDLVFFDQIVWLNYISTIEIKEILVFLLGTAVHNLFPSYPILPAGIETHTPFTLTKWNKSFFTLSIQTSPQTKSYSEVAWKMLSPCLKERQQEKKIP